ncbi:MAG: lactate utilization protein C [Frankiaceae bacterium]
MTAREQVLAAVRAALRDVPAAEAPGDVPVPRDYRRAGELSSPDVVALLVERVADYQATVHRAAGDEVAGLVGRILDVEAAERVLVAPGLDASWWPAVDGVVADDGSLGALGLDAVDAAVTGCAVAIAETGTLVLDGSPRCGRRLLSLVPDLHVCVVDAADVVATVPEALERVDARKRPVTLVSGPSATSDIELSRVEGVHGPRRLHVVIVDEA